MKILAFSDLHLARRAAADLVAASADADLVIGAGDFCNMREGLDQAMQLLAGIAAPMVLVPGNNESAEELRAAAPASVPVLHGEELEIGGLRLFGLGGAVPPAPFGDWSWDVTEETAEALLAPCDAVDVLVVHSPPKGVADRTSTGLSVGSTAVRAAIERLQPQLALCGHIHDCWGERGQIGRTEVVNLGPAGTWFEVGE
ncbi:metallophosphoesterase family protein [Pseudodonghicola xiamenensis]|uniref:Serine/threonine protein phosphatase n=1 Tax=Pseudodonghicola xiamenensis TaxID=337702 RepID=A0A8J3H6E4_9RHOB|nr:metallophosphoesterase family protein [Pseudodonghicola xiamenensis]GHG84565.1 serine/threonine protein phosphatase [Pseudodonghicola xiamenensis]